MDTQQLRRSPYTSPDRFTALMDATQPALERVRNHPVYSTISNLNDVRCFMAHHVFAVWDFMSLLKGLQAHLTCVRPPWKPVGDGMVRRFVNELVLEEESDCIDGQYTSHFEMYLAAMKQADADTTAISLLLDDANDWTEGPTNLDRFGPPGRFIETTMGVVTAGNIPRLAGAFTIGRENMIPGMFKEIVAGLDDGQSGHLTLFRHYLERHIELDGGSHGEMSAKLLVSVCGDDDHAWAEAERAGLQAIEARLALWDAVRDSIEANR